MAELQPPPSIPRAGSDPQKGKRMRPSTYDAAAVAFANSLCSYDRNNAASSLHATFSLFFTMLKPGRPDFEPVHAAIVAALSSLAELPSIVLYFSVLQDCSAEPVKQDVVVAAFAAVIGLRRGVVAPSPATPDIAAPPYMRHAPVGALLSVEESSAVLTALPCLTLAGWDVARALFLRGAPPPALRMTTGDAADCDSCVDLPVRVAFAERLVDKKRLRDAARLLCRAEEQALLARALLAPGSPVAPDFLADGGPTDSVLPPDCLVARILSLSTAAGQADVTRSLLDAVGEPRQRAYAAALASAGDFKSAARVVRDLHVDVSGADAVPLRLALLQHTFGGLLRLPARDIVVKSARADPDARAAVLELVAFRVRIGKTPAHVAGAFGIAFDAAIAPEASEAALAVLDIATDALYGPHPSPAGGSDALAAAAAPLVAEVQQGRNRARLPVMPLPLAAAGLSPILDDHDPSAPPAAAGPPLLRDSVGCLRLPASVSVQLVSSLDALEAFVAHVYGAADPRTCHDYVEMPQRPPLSQSTPPLPPHQRRVLLGIDSEWVAPLLHAAHSPVALFQASLSGAGVVLSAYLGSCWVPISPPVPYAGTTGGLLRCGRAAGHGGAACGRPRSYQ